MDEVAKFWTSSIDCACIRIRMRNCKMFLECSLSALHGGKAKFCI